jgi:O-antigen ligase
MSQPISSRFSWLHIGKNIGSNINTLLKVIRHMLNRLFTSITSPVTSLYLIGLMCCLPFTVAYHHLPIAAFYGEWLSAALGVLAMLTLLGKGFWQHFKLPQISLVFLGLASIIGMQWMLGMLHSSQYALLVLSYLAWGFVLVILGSYLRQALGWEKIALTLAWFIVLGGALNVVFVGLQLALKSGVALSFMPKLPGYGALAQVNNFADYMALATASLMYLYAKGRVTLKPFLVGLVLFITMLAFSGSRSAWLYLGAITLLAIGLQIKAIKQRTGSPHIRSLLRMSLLLLPLFAVIQLLLHNIVPDSLISLPAEELMEGLNDKTASLRLQIWQTSWHLFTQNPWLGIGAGQMRWQSFLLLDTPNINATKMILEHSHNLFIHLLTEMGVAAALFVLIGLVAWARSFKWRELDLEAWWLIALLAIIGIHSMLEYPLWYTYFLGVFAFLLGAGEEKITQLKLPQAGQAAVLATTGIFMLISIVNLSTLLIANNKLEANVMNALKGNASGLALDNYLNDMTWVHNNSLLAPYAELLLARSLKANSQHLTDQLSLSQSAMRFSPMRKIAYKNVLLHKLNQDQPSAVKQLNRTLIAYPGKFKNELEALPMKYWQDYLDVLSEARPIPIKKPSVTAP